MGRGGAFFKAEKERKLTITKTPRCPGCGAVGMRLVPDATRRGPVWTCWEAPKCPGKLDWESGEAI